MACCSLSRGAVALVAGTRVGTAPAFSSPHARVRLPALLMPRSLTATRCARGRDSTGKNTSVEISINPNGRGRDNAGMNTSIDIFIHPGSEHGSPRTEHGSPRSEDGIKRPAAPPQGRRPEEAAAALAGAVADAFRPLLDNLNQLRSFRTIFDIEDYHIGMPFGALLACVGMYQVWRIDPSTCLDIALGYAFYKLSVIAADLRKRGFSNDLIARIQLAICVIMAFKDVNKKFVPIDNIRLPVFILYSVGVLWDLADLKKYSNSALRDAFALPKKGDAGSYAYYYST